MSSHTFDAGSHLERLLNDRRVVIGGLIAGAMIVVGSLIVVNVSARPSTSKHTRAVAVLPDVPLNIPILRYWPYPDARPAAAAVTVIAPGSKVVKATKAGRVLTARR